ncbi:MAG: HAD-IIA family hydrolase [Desulfurococcales archaeon]|nr:HAD-IIA family hydrolase [Desulfurococcales archaeon]
MNCPALEEYDAVLMDLDGVLWVEGRPIDENLRVARMLAEEELLVIVTNNSTRSRRTYARMLSRILGSRLQPDRIVTSGYSASRLLRRVKGSTRVFVVGEEGLVEELVALGHEVLSASEAREAEAVVVGLDRNLAYSKLEAALKALEVGALFVATNRDHALPGRDGMKPGAGAIVAALEVAAGRKANYTAGKPERWMLEAALEAAGKPKKPIVVGDRLDTDAEMALRFGLPAVIVGTGVTRVEEVGGSRKKELVVVRSLEELCRRG